jgi:NitT/TauT family transport system ATP-binding protein
MTKHAHEAKQEDTPVVAIAAPLAQSIPDAPPKPPTLPPIVQFEKVTKTYEDGFTAIKDVTFCVDDKPNEMEFITILGPSGCGKSTILRLIAGLKPQHPATSGTVLVSGRPVLGPGADRGMVFQDYTSFDNRTVEDNIAFGLECRGMPAKERREQAREWIGKVGLTVGRDSTKCPHQLSGGMRQRVAIARSLILGPKIILMDEPFGALDPRTRLNMQDMLVSLSREAQATVFFVTHSIEEAVYLGDRTFIISSAPGTILREMPVPPPDFPARVMQQQPKFMEVVFEIRDIMETLESSTRAGDE